MFQTTNQHTYHHVPFCNGHLIDTAVAMLPSSPTRVVVCAPIMPLLMAQT